MQNLASSNASTKWLSKKWQDLPLSIKGLVFNILPLLVLLASLTSLYVNEQQAALLENKLRLTLNTQRDIQAVHTQLVEASTAVRDYLLTGNKSFLTIYKQANKKLPTMLQQLAIKLEDIEQKNRLNIIIPLVRTNLADLKVLADSTQTIASEGLIEKFSAQTNTLDSLRNEIEAMSARESILVEIEQAQVNQERRRNIQLTMAAGLAGILGSLAGAWIFSSTIVNRVRRIRDSAGHLARGEALALPSISRDELGQLTEELEHASQLLTKSANDAHQARFEAEEASAAKSNFLSRTSHELRTPLNAILGFAQILEHDLPEGRQKDSASLITGAGKHLLKLINEVLDIARIESGELALELSAFNLSDLLDEASNYIRPLGKIRDIDLVASYPDNLVVQADRQKLMQVILNLLSNALKYGPENSTVFLNAFNRVQHVIIEVEDQGKGIASTRKAGLFTPFDRLGAENTTTEGTGLGLALSKQIMDAMHGSIHLDEHKSLFWLQLPLYDASTSMIKIQPMPTEPVTHQPSQQQAAHRQKQNVLYVEDNASNRALVEAIIKRHAHLKLHLAANLKDGKHFIQNIIPDILLIDLHLPDGSGEELVQFIKENASYAHIPILILSADAMPSSISRLKSMGVTEYFTKPLDIASFNTQLNSLSTQVNKVKTP